MIANGLQVTTPDAASPYTCTSVTGYSPLAAMAAGVTFSALLEIGNDKEWSTCTHDDAGELTVVKVNATLKSGTYDDVAPTAITKSGTTTISLVMDATNVMGAASGISNIASPSRYGLCQFDSRWSNSSVSIASNRQCYVPFYLGASGEYTGIVFSLVGTITLDMKTALYSCNKDGEPGNLIAVHDTAVTYSTAANKEQSFDGGVIYLPAGWYYGFLWGDTAESHSGSAGDYLPLSPLGLDAATWSPVGYCYKVLTWNSATTPPTIADPDNVILSVRPTMGVYK
jgi:hypothetical protein